MNEMSESSVRLANSDIKSTAVEYTKRQLNNEKQ